MTVRKVVRKNFPALFSYLLVIILVFGRTLLPDRGFLIFGDDIHRQYYFYREFFNYFLSRGIFPWWNPYLFGGEPFIANPVVNIWYPPTWLFTLLPLNTAYSLHLALHLLLAMCGMRWFLKRLMGKTGQISETGAWTGGLIFGLSGFFAARIWGGHADVVAAAAWMPWVLGAFWGLLDRGGKAKNIVPAAGIFAIQLYAGYQTMAFFTAEAVGIITLLHCCLVKDLKPLVRVFAAGVLGLGLAGLQIIPEQEFFRAGIRTYNLPYSWNSYGSLTFTSLRQFINPFYFGDQLTYNGPAPNFIEQAAFVGRIGLALAVLAIVKALISLRELKKHQRNLTVPALTSVVIFGLWMSLGPNAPLDLQKILRQTLPMYQYLRIPARHLVLVVFGLSGLAGLGLWFIKNSFFRVSLTALVLVELVLFAGHFIGVKEIPEARHDQQLLKILQGDREPYRLLTDFGAWVEPRSSFDFDSGMSYRIFNATGYDPSILKSYYEYVAAAAGESGSQAMLSEDVQVPYLTPSAAGVLDRLNIKYLLVPPLYDPFAGNSRYRLLREDPVRQYRLYENTTVLPRFYLGDPQCGKADITSYTPNRIELAVQSSCRTQLLSSEVWYPGWEARVNGVKTPILKSDAVFRSVLLAKGKERIVFDYSPKIFYLGGLVSLLSLILAVVCVLRT